VAANSQYRVRGRQDTAQWTAWTTLSEVSESSSKITGTTAQLVAGKAYEIQVRTCGSEQSDSTCTASASALSSTAAAAPDSAAASVLDSGSTTLRLTWSIGDTVDHPDAGYDVGYNIDTTAVAPAVILDSAATPSFGDTTVQVSALQPINHYRLFVRSLVQWQGTDYYVSPWVSATARTGSNMNNRQVLERFYTVTNSRHWNYSTNWLSSNLNNWYGITADSTNKVLRIKLSNNRITGPLPPELGMLEMLDTLLLESNRLWGSIPQELGVLERLEKLVLTRNNFRGPIPTELGDLSKLESLWLNYNTLTGQIPPELGNLSNLDTLVLSSNHLSGPVPAELGRLSGLRLLTINHNQLSGPLPDSLTALDSLNTFNVTNNLGLCRPGDQSFTDWINGITNTDALTLPVCTTSIDTLRVKIVGAHATQATQNWDAGVPLIAGRDAVLRVFLTADTASTTVQPLVKATFYKDSTEVYSATDTALALPDALREDSTANTSTPDPSIHFFVPDTIMQAGLKVVVEVDPDNAIAWADSSVRRLPATGQLALDVRTLDAWEQTFVPMIYFWRPDRSHLSWANNLTVDHPDLSMMQKVLPIRGMDIEVHAPYTSWAPMIGRDRAFLNELKALRLAEGSSRYYLGVWPYGVEVAGLANLGGREALSWIERRLFAHEVGHNLNLRHVPGCQANWTDPGWPGNNNGDTGHWGYDVSQDALVHPSHRDIMSYCHPRWVSPFSYKKALTRQESSAGTLAPDVMADAGSGLLVWGDINRDGTLELEPAFAVNAPRSVSVPGGAYQARGIAADGRTLSTHHFDMDIMIVEPPMNPDGSFAPFPPGAARTYSSFAMIVPIRREEMATLARIEISGPAGMAQIVGDEMSPMAMVRDQATGEVLSFVREWNGVLPAGIAGANVTTSISVSRGIPR